MTERSSLRLRPVFTPAFAGSVRRSSNAIPKAWAVRSVAEVSARAGPMEAMSRRLSGSGSATARWSWTTTPLGTNTSQRPASRYSVCAASAPTGSPTAAATTPAVHPRPASTRGPTATPATETAHIGTTSATTTGPGGRSRKRCSSP